MQPSSKGLRPFGEPWRWRKIELFEFSRMHIKYIKKSYLPWRKIAKIKDSSAVFSRGLSKLLCSIGLDWKIKLGQFITHFKTSHFKPISTQNPSRIDWQSKRSFSDAYQWNIFLIAKTKRSFDLWITSCDKRQRTYGLRTISFPLGPYVIGSMIIVKLKSQITLLHRVPSG